MTIDLTTAIAIVEREKAWLDAEVPKYGTIPYPEWNAINGKATAESKARLLEAGATIEKQSSLGAWFDFAGIELLGRMGLKAMLCEWLRQAERKANANRGGAR